jgi:hypothetical protein
MPLQNGDSALGNPGNLWLPRIGIEQLWLLLPFFVILWKGMLYPIPLMDFWWHLKMGELIVTSHTIPTTDAFSFTASGQFFAIQNWLAESIYYVIYKVGGLPCLIMFNSLLLAAAILPIYSLCRKSSRSLRLGIIITVIAAVILVGNIRPQVFSVALFSLYYWILEAFCQGRRRGIWYLPLLMLLWANLHGAFIVGIALIAIYLISELIRGYINPEAKDILPVGQRRHLFFAFALTLGATLINPHLHHVYAYIRAVVSDPGSRIFVGEWQAPRIDSLQGLLLFYGFFYAAAAVLIGSKIRPTIKELLLFIFFSAFALTALRNCVWFIIISAPVLTKYISFMLPERGRVDASPKFKPLATKAPHGVKKQHFAANLILIFIILLALILVSPWVRPLIYGASLYEEGTPVGAMDYISRNDLKGNIFHPQIFGDYLIWRLWPKHRSFVDGRVHLFGDKLIQQYRLLPYNSDWERILQSYKIRYLLLSKNKNQPDSLVLIENARASGNWIGIYEDSLSILLEKRPTGGGTMAYVHETGMNEK